MVLDLDAGSVAAFVVPGIVVPVVLAARNLLGSGRRQAERWAAAERVALTEATADPVRRHLKRIRCARSLAALPLWWLAFVRVVAADVPEAVASPYPALVAYVVAGLVAELTSPPLGTDPVPRASLVPRTTADYLPTWLRGLAVGLVVLAAGVVAGSWNADVPGAAAHAPLVLLVAAAAVAIVVAELAVPRIVRRPQRTGDPHVLAADDALRATSVAMAYAVALLASLAAASTTITLATPEGLGWWATPLVLLAFVLAGMQVGVLVGLVRQETWGYRRRHRPPQTPVVPFTARADRRRSPA